MLRFDNNWAYSWAWGSLTMGVGWPSTSFPSLTLHSNVNPHGFLYPMPNPPTQPYLLYSTSTISSFVNCNYSSICISWLLNSKRKRDLSFHLLFLPFSVSHVRDSWQNQHSNLQVNLGHPLVISYDMGIHVSPHLRAPRNNMPSLGIMSWWVGE